MIYALGPEGTFSDKAAMILNSSMAQPPGWRCLPSIASVFERVIQEEGSLGVVPIENSIVGSVNLVQDLILHHPVCILHEVYIPVAFKLLARGSLGALETVFVHPVAERQCAGSLRELARGVRLTLTDSNTDSGQRLLGAPGLNAAAVVPQDFVVPQGAGLTEIPLPLASHNATRFLAIGKAPVHLEPDFGREKMSLLITPHLNRPGLLHDVLGAFQRHDINLSRIESRPGPGPWEYIFFLDALLHGGALGAWQELIRGDWDIRLLGCYSRVHR